MTKLVSVLGVGALFAALSAAAATVVLRVNGSGITDVELAQAKRAMAAQMKSNPDDPAVVRRAVEQAIGHALLVQAAREAGVKVDPADVQKRIAAQKARYPSAEAFSQALQGSGLTESDLARREEENLLILGFTEDRLGPAAVVTPAEARAYYDKNPTEFDHAEQVKVRMILVSVPEGAAAAADDGAKLRISQAYSRLEAGEDFAKVAGEVSNDPTQARGGEVGWVARGQLLPELDTPVFELKDGGFTKPIRSKFGYHIMGVTAHRPAGHSSFGDVEATLTQMLKGIKVRESIAKLVSDRRATAKIETLDPALGAVLAAPKPGA